ncbi:MAG: glycosyltransferase [Myxococcaceae bacterium]
MKRLLYLTADGVLEALGFSQVVRVIEALAKRGWQYELFSLEKPKDLERTARVREVRERLARAGIEWRYEPWAVGGSGRDAVQNELALIRFALQRARRGGLDAIHARAYHGAVAAFACKSAYGTPYLFDTRSYWFDERLEEGRWFTSPVRLGLARGVEHQLFAQAAGVVTLTELQADDVRQGAFGPNGARPVQCITTTADFDDFVRKPLAELRRVPGALVEQLRGRRVLGIVGSLNRSYLVKETLELIRLVQQRDPRAWLLVLSAQQAEYEAAARAAGLPLDRLTVTRADHDAMPEYLSLLDWSPLLLQPASRAKRASMPTKLAEFFACGVRPAQFGCSSEVSDWVRRAGTGVVLPSVEPGELARAADVIAASTRDEAALQAGRERAAEHFSLASGTDKYDAVLRQMARLP